MSQGSEQGARAKALGQDRPGMLEDRRGGPCGRSRGSEGEGEEGRVGRGRAGPAGPCGPQRGLGLSP